MRLLLEDLFDVADLFLDLACNLLIPALGFKIRVIGCVADLFLYRDAKLLHAALRRVRGLGQTGHIREECIRLADK